MSTYQSSTNSGKNSDIKIITAIVKIKATTPPHHTDNNTHDEGSIGESSSTTSPHYFSSTLHNPTSTDGIPYTSTDGIIPDDCHDVDPQRSATADLWIDSPSLIDGQPYSQYQLTDQDEPALVNIPDNKRNSLPELLNDRSGASRIGALFQQYQIYGQPQPLDFSNQDETLFLINRVFENEQQRAYLMAIADAQRKANASVMGEELLPPIDSLKLTRQKAVVPIRGISVSSLCSSEDAMTDWDRETRLIFERMSN